MARPFSPSAAITLSRQEQGHSTSSALILRRGRRAGEKDVPFCVSRHHQGKQIPPGRGHMEGGNHDKVLTPCLPTPPFLLGPSPCLSHLMAGARSCPSCQGTLHSLGWRNPVPPRPRPPSLHVRLLLPGDTHWAHLVQGVGGGSTPPRRLTDSDWESHSSARQRWGVTDLRLIYKHTAVRG